LRTIRLPQRRSRIDKANRGLSNSLNNVLTVRADVGTKMNELENWIRWVMTVRWVRPSR
jgi:flagellin-like hook-associated protein FlgL